MKPHPNCPRWLDNCWLPSLERLEYFGKSQFFVVNKESFRNDTKRKESKFSSPNLAYFHNLQTTSFVKTDDGRNSTVPAHCTKLLENQAVFYILKVTTSFSTNRILNFTMQKFFTASMYEPLVTSN